jgi:hypothetical protein
MARIGNFLSIITALVLVAGCAGVSTAPVREAMEENHKIPVGTIEGNQFTGIRYPFKVSIPSNWKMSTEFPSFLEELGYDKPSPQDKEQTELYIFNPQTQSSMQIDLTPADRYTVFSQASIEGLTNLGTESLRGELKQEYGEGFKMEVAPTEPISLKGVQYAAKKYVTYTVNGVNREQGWIYAFSEPYQIFILYMILDKDGTGMKDREDMKKILESFEVVTKKQTRKL